MKTRIEKTFAQQKAQEKYGQRLELLEEYEQKKLFSQVYRQLY
jgi:DNA helicase-2/ATP-dependent DNA helicase PcrA